MHATTFTASLCLSATDIDMLPWQDVDGCPGVKTKKLWQSSGGADALISYAPGATTPGHPHPNADHHIWVTEGHAWIAGKCLPAGSYAYVAPGTTHPIEADRRTGCVLLQIHRPRSDSLPQL